MVQSFQAASNIFDLIIIDEASQCDLRTLPVLFRGKKILVVGDPEQISPSSVGIEREKVFELLRQFISDIPYAETTFIIDNGLYNITQSISRMNRTLLTEHFRCVPEIIEFNGEKQAKYISGLIAQRIDEAERKERRIICGDAYAFQEYLSGCYHNIVNRFLMLRNIITS